MTKFNRIALALLASQVATTGHVMAEDDWLTVYGKVFLTLDAVDEDNGDDQWEINSNASRIGVKGKGAAGDLEVFYQLEWEVNITDSSKSSDDNIKSRNQFVGLRGDFGEVLAGRNDTPLKKAQQKIDVFSDTQFDIKTVLNGENRIGGILQYATPSMNGFKATAMIIPGEETGSEDGLADGVSTSLSYKSGDFQLTAAFDDGVDSPEVETMRVAASYKAGDVKFGVIYQDTDNAGLDGDGFVASLSYKLDKTTLKFQYADSDVWQAGVSSKVKYENQLVFGADYKYAKNTTFTTYYGMSEEGATGDDDSVFGVGVIQKF